MAPECDGEPSWIVTMKIALSKGSGSPKYQHYADWLLRHDPTAEIIDLARDGDYSIERAVAELRQCAGIVFTGGSDLDPALYGRGQDVERCGPIDRERDDFELELFRRAQEWSLPVLGICRGAQLINVALGGTLIVDVPTECPSEYVHTKTERGDSEHEVAIEAGTTLGKMLHKWNGTVNSAHHQAVSRVGSGLRVAVTAPDGIIEAIESDAPEERGFLIAVQWHPERMWDATESPFSRVLAERFLFECRSYELLLHGRSYDREQFMAAPDEFNGGV